jgi:CelD/BcsL family acetyltransferase involved in cellulose biosynthesis
VVATTVAGGGWDAWVAGRSKSFRSGLKYDRKQLSRIGEVRLEKIDDPLEIERMVAWIFDVKRRSLRAHGIDKSWVFGPDGQNLFTEVTKTSGGVNVHALMAGETIAAAAVVFQSSGLMEYYTTSYNHDLHVYSPGNLLLEDLVKVCLETRSVLDFRITGEAYKIRWATGAKRFDSYIIATSWRGALPVINHIRSRAEVRMKIAIKAKLTALRQKLRKPAPSS